MFKLSLVWTGCAYVQETKKKKMTSLEVKDRPSTHSQNNMPLMAQISSLKGRIM